MSPAMLKPLCVVKANGDTVGISFESQATKKIGTLGEVDELEVVF